MFGHRYFGAAYFGPEYFGPAESGGGGGSASETPTPRKLAYGLGPVAKPNIHPHPLFSKITG